jgi:hypothetical protein
VQVSVSNARFSLAVNRNLIDKRRTQNEDALLEELKKKKLQKES